MSRLLPFSELSTARRRRVCSVFSEFVTTSVVLRRSSLAALTAYLDAFQRVADMAAGTKGGFIRWTFK